MPFRPAFDRLMEKIDFDGPVVLDTPCWLWTASTHPNGYGRFEVDGRSIEAHRAANRLLIGEVPEDLELDHLCRIRACVNPQHLDAVPHGVNLARSPLVGRCSQLRQAAKTRCPKDHLYDLIDEKGRRRCRTCRRAQRRRDQ